MAPIRGLESGRTATRRGSCVLGGRAHEIVTIMRERNSSNRVSSSFRSRIMRAFARATKATMIAALEAHRRPRVRRRGRTALHWAATAGRLPWLCQANVHARTRGVTPMDVVGDDTDARGRSTRLIARLTEMLSSGDLATARWAIVANDANWLRASRGSALSTTAAS
jgi:hypothetical protein